MIPSIGTTSYSFLNSAAQDPKSRIIPPSLAIKPGNKVLSIGFGVKALELELTARVEKTGLLVIAEMPNEPSKQVVHAKLDSINTKFDRIHCRLLLSEMTPKWARSIVVKMLDKLEVGGRLVLEEALTHQPFQQVKRTTSITIKNFLESLRYKVTHVPPTPCLYNLEAIPHPNIAQISLTKYY